MLINKSYFVGERDVPNTNSLDASSLLDNIINIREKSYLIDALGYELYSKFVTALQNETDEQRMLDLLFGKAYVGFNGQPTRWEGFIKILDAADPITLQINGVDCDVPTAGVTLSDELVSPICDYVYFYWIRQKRSQTTDMGEVKAQGQNSDVVSAKHKAVASWNCMVEKTLKLDEFMRVNYDVYPEYQFHTGSVDHRLLLTTLNPLW